MRKEIAGNVARANSILLLFFPPLNLGSTPFLKLSFPGKGACQRVGGLISKFDPNFYRVFEGVLIRDIKTTHILNIMY